MNDDARVYVPVAIGALPTTPREALLSAAALLSEEGRWLQGHFYRNEAEGTDRYKDDPYCNGWGTCAVGALQCVTLGVRRHELPDYTQGFDHTENDWCRVTRWTAPEDLYTEYTEGWADVNDSEHLSTMERIYIQAHMMLDAAAMRYTSGEGGIISYNDRDGATREQVVFLFQEAAA